MAKCRAQNQIDSRGEWGEIYQEQVGHSRLSNMLYPIKSWEGLLLPNRPSFFLP